MRVLHIVASSEFAGVERYVANVAPRLARRGCDISVAGGDGKAMRALLDEHGITHVPARNLCEGALRVHQSRPLDVVHSHMTSADWAAALNWPLSRAVFVSTRHFAARRGRRPGVRTMSRVLPRLFSAQIAISSFVASHAGERTVLMLNGVPRCDAESGGSRTVVVVQRLEAEKESALALDAWRLSVARHEGWRMVVAGTGALAGELRRYARSLGLDRSVDFVGYLDDTGPLLQRAGVFLATAPCEPFGLSVVEAMSAGVPVVAAAGGGHLETVGTCTTEYLYPPGDAAACAERLDALVADADARRRYGDTLQAHQRAHFDIEDHVDRLLDLYTSLVEKRRQATNKNSPAR